jgi:group I intron endonuclease
MISGIYKISNILTGGFYIGRSVDVLDRMTHHKNELLRNVHRNKRLQNSWNKHGKSCFEFKLLWEESKEFLEELEGFILEEIWGNKNLYNHHKLSFGGFQYGNKLGCFPRTKETKEKMSKAIKGRIYSEEHNKKVSLSKIGKTASDITKKKMSDNRKGKPRPQSWHDKMAEYRANNPNPMLGKISPMRGKKFPTIKCEHCGKEATKGNYNRWHGNICKLKE